jgi:hypothetical protein
MKNKIKKNKISSLLAGNGSDYVLQKGHGLSITDQ